LGTMVCIDFFKQTCLKILGTVPSPRGALVRLVPQNKAPSPPN